MTLSNTWIKWFASCGYAARGIVYLIVGIFAILAAIGSGEKKSTSEALRTVLDQPLGETMLWLMIAGMAGYVLWRLIQSIFDTDNHKLTPKGIAIRLGLLASAFTYATLILFSLSLLGVFQGNGGGQSAPFAQFLTSFLGHQMVAIVFGLIFLGVAGAHIWKAIKQKYADHFDAPTEQMIYIHPVSMAGLIARGLLFAVVAILFFYRAFVAGDISDNPGLKEALQFLQDLPFGTWLLALAGLGLIIFAAYSLIEAKWRRINIEDA